MPIQVRCPGCNRVRTVPDEWAGKTVTCNDCHSRHVVAPAAPLPMPAMPPMPTGSPFMTPGTQPMPPGMAPVPAVAPGVPSSGPAGAGNMPTAVPRAEDVLAGYAQVARPARANFMANVKGFFQNLGKRAKVLKLQHDAKTLEAAVESQLESLGKQALTHRPAGLDFQRELSELGAAQTERGRKQAELNALANTPGSGAAAKQLRKELSDLGTRERQLMIAVGRSAATGRPEMPDGGAQYSALDRLNATLAGCRGELQQLQAQLAAQGPGGFPWKTAAVVGGGAAGLVVVGLLAYFVLMPLVFGGGGGQAWAAYYIPEGTKVVGYFNIDALRKSELWSPLEKSFKKQVGAEMRGLEIDPADVSEVFAAGDEGDPIVMVRMREDRPLKNLLPKDARERTKTKSYKDVEYLDLFGTAIAKTSARTFCIAPKEEMLKEAISRAARKERVKLSTNLQSSLSAVAGGDFYLAGSNPSKMPMPFEPEAFHVRAWLGSSLDIQATVTFAKSEEAEKAKKMLDAALVAADEAPKQLKPLFKGISIKQSGKALNARGVWKTKDLKEMLADLDSLPVPF